MKDKKLSLFVGDYLLAIESLSMSERGEVFTAIVSRVTETECCELSPLANLMWLIVSQQMDRMDEFSDQQRQKRLGKTKDNQKEPTVTKLTSYPNPVPSPVLSISKEDIGGGKATRKRFAPPTIEEVKRYGKEYQGSPFYEAEKFVDFYTSKDWIVGKVKMKDWQAACRNWIRKDKPVATSEPKETERAQARRERERLELAAVKENVEFPEVQWKRG